MRNFKIEETKAAVPPPSDALLHGNKSLLRQFFRKINDSLWSVVKMCKVKIFQLANYLVSRW